MLRIQRARQVAPTFIPDFTDPLGLLVHCHAKIEAQLGALERAVRALREGGAGEVEEAFRAIEAARAHFAGPGVKHTADEEESLFPRLRRHAGPDEGGVLAALDELEAQHVTADRAHAALDAVVEQMRGTVPPTAHDVDELAARVDALVALYGPHIALENDAIFPAAARVLPPVELLGLGEEMRARRREMLRDAGARDG
jgi:pyridoxamine 5'-phosphate oxidase